MSSSNITTPPPSLTSVVSTTSSVRDSTTPLPSSSTALPTTTSQTVPTTTTQPTTSPASPATTPSTTSTTPSIVTATQPPITSTFQTVIVTTVSPSNETPRTVTQTITSTNITPGGATNLSSSVFTSSAATTGTSTAEQPTSSSAENSNAGGGGLNGTAKVVVAVIVPIIGVAFVAILMLFLWKRRQKTRADAEARRKEVEEYGYNPNNDPHGGAASTAAGVGVARSNSNGEETLYEMTESDGAGYRGWGSTNGGRKASNMGSSVGTSVPMSPVGMAFSDGGFTQQQQQQQQQNIIGPVPDGYTGVATSPSTSTFPAGNSPSVDGSNAPLIHGSRPLTADSSVIGAMNGPAAAENSGGIHRGISNASSNYSAMTQSDQSDIGQPMSHHDAQYYGVDDGYEDAYYSSRNPAHPYSGDNGYGPAPVIRDVSARRNTRIETPTSTHFPQQGNSGIAQNF